MEIYLPTLIPRTKEWSERWVLGACITEQTGRDMVARKIKEMRREYPNFIKAGEYDWFLEVTELLK